MPPVLHVRFFGGFVLKYDDKVLTSFHSGRLQSLFCYLVLHADSPQSRKYLAYLFWPDSKESQALSNLRKLLTELREELPNFERFLIFHRGTVQWNPDSLYTADIIELDKLFAVATRQYLSREENTRVLDLYKGELLPSCYDDWIGLLRQKYQSNVEDILKKLLTQLESARAYEEGVHYAQRLLGIAPVQETSYQRMMKLQMLMGDRSGALQTYKECKVMLQKELGVEPSAETQDIYQQIIKGSTGTTAKVGTLLKAAPMVGTTKLVARIAEWQFLLKAWDQVQRGRTQFIVISGEAGIGKTRLAEELLIWADQQGILTARTRSYAAHQMLAYAPLLQLLRSPSLYNRMMKVKAVWLGELARLLPGILEERPEIPKPEPLIERLQRLRLYEALIQGLLADDQPLLLLLDDIQWCDEETLEWLQYLMTTQRTARLLLVSTMRLGEISVDHPLHALIYSLRLEDCLTEVELAPLTADEVNLLAEDIAGNPLMPDQSRSLYTESEGNPLCVVEMVRAIIEHVGKTPLFSEMKASTEMPYLALPPKVVALFQARLARLSASAHDLAAIAAAIGRSFTFDVLLEASQLAEDVVVRSLDELCQHRIIKEQRADLYDFSHDRIRDVVYGQEGRARRQFLHRRIGAALVRLYAGNLDAIVGELATHAEHAGEIQQAIEYLQHAAEIAQSVVAYPEAVTRLRHGLTLLNSLHSVQESVIQQELAMLVPLGAALIALRGYADPEVQAVYSHAQHICLTIGDDPHLMPILMGLSLFYMVRGELQQALSTAQQSLQLAQRTQDAGLLLEGHVALGAISVYLAQFQEARAHLEEVLVLYDPRQHRDHAAIYGQDPGVACHMFLALCLWYLGYADNSLNHLQQGLALARTISHPYTLNLAQFFATWLYHMRQEPTSALESATADIELARQYGFQLWLTIGLLVQGWATIRIAAVLDDANIENDEIIAQMLDAFAGFQQTGAGLSRGYYLGFIAEAQAAAGRVEAGLASIDEALVVARSCADRYFLADVQRLLGDLLLLQNGDNLLEREAEAAFVQAIETAKRQDAKLLELRAATSLARLWTCQGKADSACNLLKSTLGWFTEGFDTPALKEAKALLGTLG